MDSQPTITIPVRSLAWFSSGVAVTLILSVMVVGVRAAAAPKSDESTFVPIVPCRVFDTRPAPDNVGPRSAPLGADQSYELQITGTNGDCAIPPDATGISMNLTALNATQSSFMQVYPADASRPEKGSSLNYSPGQSPTPNKVDVGLSPDGAVKVYNLRGSVDALGDIVGYYTNAGIQAIVDDLATKADAANVYSRAEADADFVGHGDIVLSHSTSDLHFGNGEPTTVTRLAAGNQISGDGTVIMALTGPSFVDGVEYGLRSVEYCLFDVLGGAMVTSLEAYGLGNVFRLAFDDTDRTAAGCYSLDIDASGEMGYDILLFVGGGGSLRFGGLTSTWAPADNL